MPLVFSTIDSICSVNGYVSLVGRLILTGKINQDMLGLAAGRSRGLLFMIWAKTLCKISVYLLTLSLICDIIKVWKPRRYLHVN